MRRNFIVSIVVAALLPLTVLLVKEPYGVAPLTLFQAFFVGALFIAFFAPFGCFVKKHRQDSLQLFAVAIVFLTTAIPVLRNTLGLRSEAFQALAERSKPLVEAIRAYESEKKKPPASLRLLIPKYFDSIPSTGIKAYPSYIYKVGAEYGNAWSLSVPAPSGINFDQFIYLPMQNYPERGFGGHLERMGAWAYVHE